MSADYPPGGGPLFTGWCDLIVDWWIEMRQALRRRPPVQTKAEAYRQLFQSPPLRDTRGLTNLKLISRNSGRNLRRGRS